MKNVIILIICLFSLKNTKAQVLDTSIYINQIVSNKNLYIGKSFSYLEQNLKIKLKFFTPLPSFSYDKTKETNTTFGFLNPVSPEDFSFPRIYITWMQPLNATTSMDLYGKYDGGMWAPELSTFYGGAIIKDIKAD